MNNNESKKTTIITPMGIAKFPKLNMPDFKFNKAGIFSVDLVLAKDDAAVLREQLATFEEDAYNHMLLLKGLKSMNKADSPLKKELDQEGKETGNFVIKIKTVASFTDQSGNVTNKTVIVDDKHGERTDQLVMAGSKIKVRAIISSYFTQGKFGITARLNRVQVKEFSDGPSGADIWGSDNIEKKSENSSASLEL